MPAVTHKRKNSTPTTEFVPRARPVPVETPSPVTSWVTVTPEVAAMWLAAYNDKNRSLRESYVTRLATDMSEGKWRGRNGEAIRFDTTGRLVDGQHRLRACIAADRSFDTLLVTGVDPEDYLTIGIGQRKSMADFLGPVHGEKNAVLLASTLRLVYMWGKGTLGKSEKHGAQFPTVQAMEQCYKDHPNLPESCSWIASHRDLRNLLTPSYGALIAEYRKPPGGPG